MLHNRRWGIAPLVALMAITLLVVPAAYGAVSGMTRVSLRGASGQLGASTAPCTSSASSVSKDGRYVAFESDAPGIASGAYAGGPSIYLRDRTSQETTLVSRPWPGTGQANGPSHKPKISADGRYVVFASAATNLMGPWDGVSNAGIFRWDRLTGSVERVDVAPAQTPFAWNATLAATSQDWWWTAISDDGRYIAYSAPAAQGSSRVDVHRRDMVGGEIVTVSVGRASDGAPAVHPAISADGARVAFSVFANLDYLAAYSGRHVYLRDIERQTTALVSAPDPALAGAADSSDWPALNASGTVVAFVSSASNLVSTSLNAVPNVLVRDIEGAATTLASKGSRGPANWPCYAPSLSRDGRYVAFQSGADNLKVSGTTYPYHALYVLDRTTGVLTATGAQTSVQPDDSGSSTGFTGESRFVTFSSASSGLVSGDTNASRDVFLFEYKAKPVPTVTTPSLSTSYVRRYRSFYISGKVSRHSGAQGKVEIRVYRRLSTGPKLYKAYTVYTGVGSAYYKKKLSLPSTGKWCVRTYHAECGVYASKYSSYRYFTVYR